MPEKGYATASFIVDEAADSLWEGRRRDMVFVFFWGGGVWFCFGVLWVVFFLHAPAAVGCRRSIGSGLRGRRVGRDRYELGLSTRKQGDGHDEAIRMVRDLLSQPDFTLTLTWLSGLPRRRGERKRTRESIAWGNEVSFTRW